jgi:site-specific recombinase XerD
MMTEKKYQIFISSTYLDLIKARQKVTETVLSMYHFPIGMEMFSAGNYDQWTTIKNTIDNSDYYVLIIGHRYGSVTEEGISYTEKEYDYALEKGLPILAFIRNRDVPTKPSERDSDSLLQTKLNNFVNKATNSKMCDFWNTEEELASKVSIALNKEFMFNPRVGWIRSDQSPSNEKGIKNSIANYNLGKNIERFLEEKKRQGLSNLTISSYQLHLRIFNEFSNGKLLSEINSRHIKDFLIYREDAFKVNSINTMGTIRGIINLFFDWLVDEKVIDSNPVSKVSTFKSKDVTYESLEEVEIIEIQNACKNERERALIEILLSTGCHLGEIESIKLSNINWNKNTVRINGSNQRNRLVLLNKQAEYYLKKYIDTREDDTDYLFVTERKPFRSLSNRGIQRQITIIIERTNIKKKISPRTFRQTFAKKMLEKGCELNVLQALLGHKNASTSETYVKLTDENISKAVKVLW